MAAAAAAAVGWPAICIGRGHQANRVRVLGSGLSTVNRVSELRFGGSQLGGVKLCISQPSTQTLLHPMMESVIQQPTIIARQILQFTGKKASSANKISILPI